MGKGRKGPGPGNERVRWRMEAQKDTVAAANLLASRSADYVAIKQRLDRATKNVQRIIDDDEARLAALEGES